MAIRQKAPMIVALSATTLGAGKVVLFSGYYGKALEKC
jgi:hypothetical protein